MLAVETSCGDPPGPRVRNNQKGRRLHVVAVAKVVVAELKALRKVKKVHEELKG